MHPSLNTLTDLAIGVSLPTRLSSTHLRLRLRLPSCIVQILGYAHPGTCYLFINQNMWMLSLKLIMLMVHEAYRRIVPGTSLRSTGTLKNETFRLEIRNRQDFN